MKKLLSILVIFNLFSNFIFSMDKKYELEILSTIPIGNAPGKLGYKKPVGGNVNGPMDIVLTDNNLIYISDPVNKRINIYDGNFTFKNSIKDTLNYGSSFANKLVIFDNYLCFYEISTGLGAILMDGNQLYLFSNSKLPKEVTKNYGLFNLNNFCLFYNREKNSYFNLIKKSGEWIKGDEAYNEILDELTPYTNNLYKNLNRISIEYFKKNSVVINDNKILSDSFQDHRNFNNFLNLNSNQITEISKSNLIDYTQDLPQINSPFLECYDTSGNSYWRAYIESRCIVVVSKFGAISKILNLTNDLKNMHFIGVTSNGSMIFMKLNDKKTSFDFYKLEMNE